MRRHIHVKSFFIFVWAICISITVYWMYNASLPLSVYPDLIAQHVGKLGMLAPIAFVAIYTVRPLLFFPATILSLAAGLLFGPWKAIVVLIIAGNLSSLVSFSVGKYVGKNILHQMDEKNIWIHKFTSYFHHNDLITVLILRLIYAPFDLVGYFAGASNIRYRSFALGTFIGIIPGITTFAFLGGSTAQPTYLLMAFIFFVLGLGISKYIKSRYSKDTV